MEELLKETSEEIEGIPWRFFQGMSSEISKGVPRRALWRIRGQFFIEIPEKISDSIFESFCNESVEEFLTESLGDMKFMKTFY